MRIINKLLFGIPLMSLIMVACNDNIPVTEITKKPANPYKENMMTASNYVAKSEEARKKLQSGIDQLANTVKVTLGPNGWDDKVQRFDNGLRLWEYQKGNDGVVNYDDELIILYNVQSITGKDIYTDVVDTVVVGRNLPNIGIDKALLYLNYGSKARVILPSHLGFGFVGDADRIGTNMILVYDLEVKQKR